MASALIQKTKLDPESKIAAKSHPSHYHSNLKNKTLENIQMNHLL